MLIGHPQKLDPPVANRIVYSLPGVVIYQHFFHEDGDFFPAGGQFRNHLHDAFNKILPFRAVMVQPEQHAFRQGILAIVAGQKAGQGFNHLSGGSNGRSGAQLRRRGHNDGPGTEGLPALSGFYADGIISDRPGNLGQP